MSQVIRALVIASLALAAPAWAHPPDEHGHHADHPADPARVRTWSNSKTGEMVRGAFLAARSREGIVRVSIERENGDVVVFALDDLAEADRNEALRRIEEARSINDGPARSAQGEGAADPKRPAQAAAFDLFAPHVRTRWDDRWLYVESDGLPHAPWSYPVMVGIKSWQQQVPLPQPYTGDNAWRIPLKPELADQPISGRTQLYRGAIALAANGVPIFNALNNRGEDAFKAGELDEYGGHCGRADDYHYHVAPLAIQGIIGKDKPIAYALDGFPIYGLFNPAAKVGGAFQDQVCPLGGTERLDELNGHFGAAPKDAPAGAKGLYHYHASLEYPYVNGGVRGRVTVKEDQIDPQPRASPVRQWLQPLRGAAITGFKTIGEKSWSLGYTLAGKKHLVNFRWEGTGADASWVFDFIDPDGTKKTETYRSRPARGDRERRQRGDRPALPESSPTQPDALPQNARLRLHSTDVKDGRLSIECTCDGKGRAPALAWDEPPKGTRAFAAVMHHVPPDGGAHVYMVLANVPATARELNTAGKAGLWGQNTVNRRNEYAPPCSKGPGDKMYIVTLYALSAEVNTSGGAALTRDALLARIKDSTLATATMEVKYAREGGARKDAE